jgi:hypothetical protein
VSAQLAQYDDKPNGGENDQNADEKPSDRRNDSFSGGRFERSAAVKTAEGRPTDRLSAVGTRKKHSGGDLCVVWGTIVTPRVRNRCLEVDVKPRMPLTV